MKNEYRALIVFLGLAGAIAGCTALEENENGDTGEGETATVQQAASHRRHHIISSRESHTCAVTSAGAVNCWGYGASGKLGNNSTSNQNVPVSTGLSGAIAISVGSMHSCALKADGTVFCWGNNGYFQTGDGSSTPTDRLMPVQVSGLTNAVAVAAGANHSCAVRSDGTSVCWGNETSNGELGNGSTAGPQATPTQVNSLTNAVAIAAGRYHTCALLSDGTVSCWGDNSYGQLGNGNFPTDSNVPFPLSTISSAVAISAGDYFTCALLVTGAAKCWGRNESNELGNLAFDPFDSSTFKQIWPVPVVSLANAITISSGPRYSCAILHDHSTRCWGFNGNTNMFLLGDSNNTSVSTNSLVTGATTNVADITAGDDANCVALIGGGAKCWGYGFQGQLGHGFYATSPTAVPVSSLSGVSRQKVVGGGNHTCALVPGGTVKCWGANFSGQLGINSTSDQYTPTTVVKTGGGNLTDVVDVAAHRNNTCALDSSGSVYCWGENIDGQIGDETTTARSVATAVHQGADKAVQITVGRYHACMRLANGSVKCWGQGTRDQLGDGNSTSVDKPTSPVSSLTDASSISAGSNHTCALKANGSVVCWGANSRGELGCGDFNSRSTPEAVSISSVTDLATSGLSTCAVVANGTMMCWGFNSYGELGNNDTSDENTPVTVSTYTDFVSTWPGAACGIRANGSAYCWGANGSGQVGDGTTTNQWTPAPVSSLGTVAVVGGGSAHRCAILPSGAAKCWGQNTFGQLGNDPSIYSYSSTPLLVSSFP